MARSNEFLDLFVVVVGIVLAFVLVTCIVVMTHNQIFHTRLTFITKRLWPIIMAYPWFVDTFHVTAVFFFFSLVFLNGRYTFNCFNTAYNGLRVIIVDPEVVFVKISFASSHS